MANNPFDPPIVQIKKTLDRGGMAGANKGFGSARIMTPTLRAAPGVQNLSELNDVGDTPPLDGDQLTYDAASGLWIPSGGGNGAMQTRFISPAPGVTSMVAPARNNVGQRFYSNADATITRFECRLNTVAGATYRVGLYPLDTVGTTTTSAAIETTTIVSPGTLVGTTIETDPIEWNIDKGIRYAIVVSRDDTVGTIVPYVGGTLAAGNPGAILQVFPAENGQVFSTAAAPLGSGALLTLGTGSTASEIDVISR